MSLTGVGGTPTDAPNPKQSVPATPTHLSHNHNHERAPLLLTAEMTTSDSLTCSIGRWHWYQSHHESGPESDSPLLSESLRLVMADKGGLSTYTQMRAPGTGLDTELRSS